jgi:hypothetical protein
MTSRVDRRTLVFLDFFGRYEVIFLTQDGWIEGFGVQLKVRIAAN